MLHLLRLFAVLALLLSIAAGSVAHASEGAECIAVAGSVAGHVDGGTGTASGDVDKAYPHHHGGCHSHHVAAPAEPGITGIRTSDDDSRILARHAGLKGATTDPALRPPQA